MSAGTKDLNHFTKLTVVFKMHIQVRTQSKPSLAFHALNLQKLFPLNLFTLQYYLEQSSVNCISPLD